MSAKTLTANACGRNAEPLRLRAALLAVAVLALAPLAPCASAGEAETPALSRASVKLDASALAADLLLLKRADGPASAALAGAAATAFDFLAGEGREAVLNYRGDRDHGNLTWVVAGKDAESLALDAPLAALVHSLVSLRQREAEAHAHPVPGERLRAVLGSRGTGAETVAKLFARTYAEAPLVDSHGGEKVWFERGGLMFLVTTGKGEEQPLLWEIADPVHDMGRRLADLGADLAAVRELRRKDPVGFLALDPQGLLDAFLERAQATPTRPRLEDSRRRIVETLLLNVASSYMVDRRSLLLTLAREPLPERARYVGLWHSHPGWPRGEPPSPDDVAVAGARGRFVTVVFVADGFEIYDLRQGDERPFDSRPPDVTFKDDRWLARFPGLGRSK